MDADLVETARHFGERIAFIHVRDVEGTKEDFTELFHDQGTTDQFALMRVYRELGLDVPLRGDHVPEMEGDRLFEEFEDGWCERFGAAKETVRACYRRVRATASTATPSRCRASPTSTSARMARGAIRLPLAASTEACSTTGDDGPRRTSSRRNRRP